MEYVKGRDLFGSGPSKEIPCLTGSGAPTTATVGAVGCLYMDEDTGNLYKCTAAADGVYTWKDAEADNLYYIPKVTDNGNGSLTFAWTPSVSGYPIPKPTTVTLPTGSNSGTSVVYIAQDTEPEDTSVLWIDTSDDGEDQSEGEGNVTKTYHAIGVLADSYGAFEGWIPDGYTPWYSPTASAGSTDVTSVRQMWWHLLCNKIGAPLHKNSSYSGSTIANLGYSGNDSSATSFLTRAAADFGPANVLLPKPDLLLVMGGTNDNWAGTAIGTPKYADWTDTDLQSVAPAACKLLHDLQEYNPGCDIVFILNDILGTTIKTTLQGICDYYGVPCIALDGIAKMDGHPNVEGMEQIATQIQTALGQYTGGDDSGDNSETPDDTEAVLSSISATYSGGDVAVGTAVTELTGVTVTAHYSDGSTQTVTGYTLSGNIVEGENTVTVTYEGKTTTFAVTGLSSAGDGGDDSGGDVDTEPTGTLFLSTLDNADAYGTNVLMENAGTVQVPCVLIPDFDEEAKTCKLSGQTVSYVQLKISQAGNVTIGKIDLNTYKSGGNPPELIDPVVFTVSDAGIHGFAYSAVLGANESLGIHAATDAPAKIRYNNQECATSPMRFRFASVFPNGQTDLMDLCGAVYVQE